MSIGLHAAYEVKSDLRPVYDKRSQTLRSQQCDRQIDRLRTDREGCWAGQEFGQIQRAPVGSEQVPAAVDDECRIRLVLREHVVERSIHDGEVRRR
jgi:hypothetical protein